MADPRHKRDTDARPARIKPRATVVAGAMAVSVTAAAVLVGVAATRSPSAGTDDLVAAQDPAASVPATPAALPRSAPSSGAAGEAGVRRDVLSRSADRTVDSVRLVREKRDPVTRWTTADLNLWTLPGDTARRVGVLDSGKKVTATGVSSQGRDEIILAGGAVRWVTSGYLSADKPVAESAAGADGAATEGLSSAPCPDSSVEDGLAADTIAVYRAVCHAFPQVTDYLGWGPREEHDTGHAIDVMVYGDKALGDEIAAWAQAHASELNLYDVIWYDRIWTPVRASEGWRDYGDHGSPTANHMDHVHIGTN